VTDPKHGTQRLRPSFIGSACLEIARSPTPSAEGHVNGHVRRGYEVALTARVESDLHRIYTSKVSAFAAPHDADIETRSVSWPLVG
jgi:hypothetical protein